MAGYEDTKKKIVDTLTGRPAGHEIQPYEHESFAMSLLDYIRSVEVNSNSMFAGEAVGSTVPIQPPTAATAYISTVSSGNTVVYTNFRDVNGNPITVTAEVGKAKIVILMWNKQYWSAQVIEVAATVVEPPGMAFMGIAQPNTTPPEDLSYAYIANEAGTYTHFNNSIVLVGQLVLFTYDKDNGIFRKTVLVNDTESVRYQNLSVDGNISLGGKLNRYDFTKVSDDCLVINVCQTLDISKVGEKIQIPIPDGYVAHVFDGEYVGSLKYCSYFNGYNHWFTSYSATITKKVIGFGTWIEDGEIRYGQSDPVTSTQDVYMDTASNSMSFPTPYVFCAMGGTYLEIEVTATNFPPTYVEDNEGAVIPKILIWGNIRCFKRNLQPPVE